MMWRQEAIRIGLILLGLAIIVAGFTVFFIREIDHRAEAERRLEELATTDALTGLTNRRKFDIAIDREWRRAVRLATPIALMIIDADHFKVFNDGYGHQAGDQVLVGIALCIGDSVQRAGDCAARFGGEEFAVLLPGLTPPATRDARGDDPSEGRGLVGRAGRRHRQHRRRQHDAGYPAGLVGAVRGRRQGAVRGQGFRPQSLRRHRQPRRPDAGGVKFRGGELTGKLTARW